MTDQGDYTVEIPIATQDDAHNSFKLFQACNDGPAFVRRARNVEAALEALLEQGRVKRDEWLRMVGIRLGRLHALLAGDWQRLRDLPESYDAVQQLAQLHQQLQPRLRVAVSPTMSRRHLRHALGELRESIERFNRRWRTYLERIDLSYLNQLRDGYNRYFVMEKECAVRSPRVARVGFSPLAPLGVTDLLALLPLLPVV